ncbi:uncharacterized protein DUF2569 [Biostraticola tofi]|uniref:Uncharacterized protein DUF2569 n=1 Tax=Biostraticola tofi TaxID=466109 RepID=A0A4R3Z6V6_9GAMM|nr:uncharacterized protein DUF2569 [Biostraticola tofi]
MDDKINAPQAAPRIAGLLWVPVAWLGVSLLSASVMVVLYFIALFSHAQPGAADSALYSPQWYLSLVTTLGMWLFTGWTLRLLLTRSSRFPKIFILWLLASVLLAIKTFAFSPVSDELALKVLLWPMLAAAVLVPFIKRSMRVKQTFIR